MRLCPGCTDPKCGTEDKVYMITVDEEEVEIMTCRKVGQGFRWFCSKSYIDNLRNKIDLTPLGQRAEFWTRRIYSNLINKRKHMLKTFAYHKPTEDGLKKITALRKSFSYLWDEITDACPASRERSIALTELETCAMWAIKAVVCNDPGSVVEGAIK